MDMKQIKSSIKNFKPTKKTILLTGGFVLIQAGVFVGMSKLNMKPFAKNTYEAHRVDFTEYNKNGKFNIDMYLENIPKEENYILLKTPYEKNYDVVSRDVYTVSTDYCEEQELEYVIDNLDNQDLVLEEDSIKNIIDRFEKNTTTRANTTDFFTIEYGDTLPNSDENNYEISYITVDDEDKKDIKLKDCNMWDNLSYTLIYLFQFLGTSMILTEYSKLFEIIKNNKNPKEDDENLLDKSDEGENKDCDVREDMIKAFFKHRF